MKWSLFVLAFATLPTMAEIHQCRNADGELYYTDQVCPDEFELEKSEMTESEKRQFFWEKEREKREKEEAKRREWSEKQRQKRLERERILLEEQEARRQERIKKAYEEGEITAFDRVMIAQKKVEVGMTAAGVRFSWGEPDDINRSGIGADQWIYERGGFDRDYVYVDDGKVVNWQTD